MIQSKRINKKNQNEWFLFFTIFRKLVLNWLAEIIDGLPQEDNGLLTLPLLLKLSHAIIDIGIKKRPGREKRGPAAP